MSELGEEWPFSDVLTHMSEVPAEMTEMAWLLSSCALSSRASSDTGSIPGKQKQKGLLSHTTSLTPDSISQSVMDSPDPDLTSWCRNWTSRVNITKEH